MKTTIEVPDALFRRAKSVAAQRGIPLRALVSEALADKLCLAAGEDKSWMKTFGKLRRLYAETLKVDHLIKEEFGRVEPKDNE